MVVVTVLKFVFIVAALLAFTFSDGKLSVEKICCSRRKTRDKYVCHGRMISLDAEMARVANAQRGNFVCEHHWHMLRNTNNICSCPLPSHSRTLSPTPIPLRLFQVFDEVGKSIPSYRPGTRWCTSCRRNADDKFSSMAKYKKASKRKKVGTVIGRHVKSKLKISGKYFLSPALASRTDKLNYLNPLIFFSSFFETKIR